MRRREKDKRGGWHFGSEENNTAADLRSVLREAGAVVGVCRILAAIEREWPLIVGEALARRSSPRSFENGVLKVAVENAGALQDMNFKKRAIVEKLGKACAGLVRDIETSVGPTARPSLSRPAASRASANMKIKKRAPIDEALVEKISDELRPEVGPELAETLARLRVLLAKK